MRSKKLISAMIAFSMGISSFAGIITASAEDTGTSYTETIYNFSDIQAGEYNSNSESISLFDRPLTISSEEKANTQTVSNTITTPLGNSVTVTQALRAKRLQIKIRLNKDDTVVVYYAGTDSGGTDKKSVSMTITAPNGTTAANEDNDEKGGLQPYTISCTADTAGDYTIVDSSTDTVRTLVYAVAVKSPATETPTESPTASPSPTPTASPTASPSPTPTASPTASPDPNTLYTTVYDFYQLTTTYEGSIAKGSFAPTTVTAGSNAPDILIDATNGKVGQNNAQWSQFTNGAKLTIPNVPAGAVVSLTVYTNTIIEINGVQYTGTQEAVSYTATKLEDVVITSLTDNGYIGPIKIVSTAFGASGEAATEAPEPTETDAADVTDAPTTAPVTVITKTTVVKAAEMTPAPKDANNSPVLYSDLTLTANTAYSAYSFIFGEDFANVGTDKYGYLGDSSYGSVKKEFTTTANGPCTFYVLASYGRDTNHITVTSSNGTVAADAVSPTPSGVVGTGTAGTETQDLYIYTYTIPSLAAGTYTFEWHSDSYASDLVALAIASKETTKTLSADTASIIIGASEMTPTANANGAPNLYQNLTFTTTAAYTPYSSLFGVNFANVGTDKYGYLGESANGSVQTDFTINITEAGSYTFYALSSYPYPLTSNQITIGGYDNPNITFPVSPIQIGQVGTCTWGAGTQNPEEQNLYLYSYTIGMPPENATYTFKWQSDSYASDLVALAIVHKDEKITPINAEF
ncbi:MAG: PT domain-containing protein, partial [Candidatus Ornithomonoglobus sp.]